MINELLIALLLVSLATEASLDVVKAIVNCNTMLDKHEPTIYLALILCFQSLYLAELERVVLLQAC